MREEIIIRTRQFARRQIQWFKKETIDLIIEMDNMDRKKLPEILHCIFMPLP
jgi:tRNA A37 N6-isopentenylltransferase MiaA